MYKYALLVFFLSLNAFTREIPLLEGERLTYKIVWGFIPVGKTYTSLEWIEFNGKRMLKVKAQTRSNSFIDKIYPVNDYIESIFDPETFLPVRFIKRLNEGKYHTDEVTLFDHKNKIAKWQSLESGKKKEYAIKNDTRDLLSFLTHMRGEKYEVNKEMTREVMADEKLYNLIIRVKKLEKVKLSGWGKVESLKMEPVATFQGIFIRRGKMIVWVSNDNRKIMTKMFVDTPFANVKLYLQEVKGGPQDFWITGKKAKKNRIKSYR